MTSVSDRDVTTPRLEDHEASHSNTHYDEAMTKMSRAHMTKAPRRSDPIASGPTTPWCTPEHLGVSFLPPTQVTVLPPRRAAPVLPVCVCACVRACVLVCVCGCDCAMRHASDPPCRGVWAESDFRTVSAGAFQKGVATYIVMALYSCGPI